MFIKIQFNNLFVLDHVILGIAAIAFLLTSIFYRSFESEFIIFQKFDFSKFKVKASLEQDSKNFITEFRAIRKFY